jgi:hypothetical protein
MITDRRLVLLCHEDEDRLGSPPGGGVPIASYRDKMGALVGANKLAYFRQQGLHIEALSDPKIGSKFSSFPVVLMLSEEMSAWVCG